MRDYYEIWRKKTLEEVLIEIDNERQTLQEILDDEPYDGRGSHIDTTRDNISTLQQIAGEISRERESAAPSPEAKLAKLQDLFNKSLISKEEYEDARASVLRNI